MLVLQLQQVVHLTNSPTRIVQLCVCVFVELFVPLSIFWHIVASCAQIIALGLYWVHPPTHTLALAIT